MESTLPVETCANDLFGDVAAAASLEDDNDEAIVVVRGVDFARAVRVVQHSVVLSAEEHAKVQQRDADFRERRTVSV